MTTGFFKVDTPSKSKKSLKRGVGCLYCKLDKNCLTPKMEASGEGKKEILIIAESPGATEDKQGTQLVGKAGRYFRDILDEYEIDIDEDCRKINAINCRPNKNRTPTLDEIQHCRSRVWEEINTFKPKVIILLGGIALESFLGHRWPEKLGGITRWRGLTIPDRNVKSRACPTFHPSYVLRSIEKKFPNYAVEVTFKKDIKRAINLTKINFPVFTDEKKKVRLLKTVSEAKKELLNIIDQKPKYLALDYETSGLKPYRQGHFIYCISFSTSPDNAVSFLMTDELNQLVKQILQESTICKIAHSNKFEDMWTNKILGYMIEGWHHCTQTGTHILDNRKKITGLKFQVYVQFGILDYSSHIDEYLKGSNEKDSNSFNRIHEAPVEEILTYCGMDAMLTHRLGLKQLKQIEHRNLTEANNQFQDGLLSMMELEQTGMNIDISYCKQKRKELIEEIKTLKKEIISSKEGKIWSTLYSQTLNLNSQQQLSRLLFNELKIKPIKMTDNDNPSTDAEVLEKIKLPFVKKLIRMRKLEKYLTTYLEGFMRETVNGVVRPFYHLNTARSYRSSSSRPNGQNIPVRDEEARKLIRDALMPSPGRQLLDTDFKSLEVGIAACVTKDPQLITYMKDPATDMHRDMCMELYMLLEPEVSKEARYSAKSDFVFPEFYGDWYEKCAVSLWEDLTVFNLKIKDTDIPIKEHLRLKGIRKLSTFIDHVQKVEDDFWNNRFKIYNQWKIDQWEQYQKLGYIDLVTGFRCEEIMDKNACLNRPIQGPAFHCLLFTLKQLLELKYENDWKTRFCMQIHDNLVQDVFPPELKDLINETDHIVKVELPKAFPWIIIPLSVEYELAPIDASWYHKKEMTIK